jgi:hypothetical protein
MSDKIDFFAALDLFKIDDEPEGNADAPDFVAEMIEKTSQAEFNVPEFPAPEKPHADGCVIEKSVAGTFHFHYKGGRLVKTEIYDQSLPGGYEVIEHPEKPQYVTAQVAEIFGLADLEFQK